MSLNDDLKTLRAQVAEKSPADRIARLDGAIAEIGKDIASREALAPGDIAPDFALPNATGSLVSLSEMLVGGPVILTFYRGEWCPFCSLELRAYQKLLPRIKALSASVIAISPQTPDGSLSTTEKNGLGFEVLSDIGCNVAKAYRIAFDIPDDLRQLFSEIGLSLWERNARNDRTLPVPATFIIERSGQFALASYDIDHRTRPDPKQVIATLQRLSKDKTM